MLYLKSILAQVIFHQNKSCTIKEWEKKTFVPGKLPPSTPLNKEGVVLHVLSILVHRFPRKGQDFKVQRHSLIRKQESGSLDAGVASWHTWLCIPCVLYDILYNNPSYSRILIGSCLWSIRGQMNEWRHHYRVFTSAVLKWRKVLRIRIIFYMTGQIIRYKKVLPSHGTGSRSKKTKDKAVSFRKWYRNNFLAASVGSRARLNHAQTCSW